MIKKTITYEDYNGDEVSEDFYFGLTKLELMEMEINHEGGLSAYIEKLTETTVGAEAYHLFKDILLKSVGRKSDDGRRFIKKDPETGRPLSEDFETSPAMTELIFSFLQDGNNAAEFMRGLLPSAMVNEVEKEAAKTGTPSPLAVAPPPEAAKTEEKSLKALNDYSKEELLELSQEDFDKVAGTDPSKMSKAVLTIAFQRKNQV